GNLHLKTACIDLTKPVQLSVACLVEPADEVFIARQHDHHHQAGHETGVDQAQHCEDDLVGAEDENGACNLERLDDERDGINAEEHTSELQSRENLVCRLLLEKKN